MKKLLLILFSIFFMFSCEVLAGPEGIDGIDGIDGSNGSNGVDGIDGADGEDGEDGEDGVGGGKLYDANDVLLGNITSLSSTWIEVVTSNYYIVTLRWNSIPDSSIKFSGTGGTGEIFKDISSVTYSKVTYHMNNQFYTFKTVADGLAVADDSITVSNSYWDTDTKVIVDSVDNLADDGYKAAILKTISRVEIGLPDTFAYPLRMEY